MMIQYNYNFDNNASISNNLIGSDDSLDVANLVTKHGIQ
jgi:hypothetical protein